MKGNLSRMWRSGLSLLLALCLVVGMCPVAFATETTTSYVSIGDSMANGYGLNGYYGDSGENVWGYGQTDAPSYPKKVADAKGWELTQLAISGFRAHEVHYLLSGCTVYADDYCESHIASRCGANGGEKKVSAEYQKAVKNADVISIGLGTNNFGTFFTSRLYSYMKGDTTPAYECDLNALLSTVDAELAAQAVVYKNQLMAKMNETIAAYGITDEQLVAVCNDMAEAAVYTLADFIISYKGVLDYIAVNNSDAEVIIVGMNNAMDDLYLAMNGETIDLSEYYGYVVELANAYMYSLPAAYDVASQVDPESEYALRVYFAPIGAVQQIANTYTADSVKNTAVVRDRFIESIVGKDGQMNGMVFSMLESLFAQNGMPLMYITRDDIENNNSQDKYLSVAIYKAFENAVIAATQENTLDGNALVKLANGLDASLFNGVASEFLANVTPDGPEIAMTNALKHDETVMSLLNMFGRYIIGEGMGCHPSEAGHESIKNAVIAAYDNGHTATDEVVENVEIVLEELYNLLETYGPEAAEQVWNALEEAGYVDYINESLSELQTALTERYDNYVEVVIPAINASVEELTAQAESLKTELTALQAELAAKKAELENAAGVAAEELEAAIAKLEATIDSVEAAIAAVETNIADLQTLVSELGTAAEQLKTQLTDLAAAAEDLGASVAALMAVLEDTGVSSVDALVSAYNAAKDAVVAAAEVLENAVAAADMLVEDIGEMAAQLKEKIDGLYEMVLADLEEAYNSLSDEEQAAVAEAIAAIQAALEEAKALVMEELEAALAALAEEYGPQIEAKKQELAALKQQIEEEIAAKYEEVKIAAEAQLAELAAQAETLKAQLEELYAQLENGAEELQAEIAEAEAKLAELTAQIEDLYAQLENATEELKAEIDAKIAELTAQADELKAQLEELYAQLENASGELKAEIEAAIEELEAQLAAVEAQIAALQGELEAALEAIRAEVEAAYAEAVAALENAIAELETAYNEAVEALKAAADAKIQELIAEAEAKLDELGEVGEAISAVIADIYAQVQEEIAAVNTAIEAILAGSIESVEDLAEAVASLAGETAKAIAAKVEEIIAAVEDAFAAATTADLVIDDEFLYVALGDGSAVSESYVDKLADALAEEAGISEINYVNEAYVGNTVANERENLSDVAGADLITIGFSNVTFLANTMQGKVNIDWNSVVGEENVAYIDQLMGEVEAKIAENGLDAETSAYVSSLVEAYAYSAVEYATELPELINEINAVNPEALIVIVGMYNPMEGVSIVLDENTSLDIGEYINYLVDGVAVHGVAYAMLTGNAIYVDARDVATNNMDAEITKTELVTMAMNGFAALYPSTTGHDSIAADVADALDVSYEQAEPAGLWGDADSNGVVNLRDALLILQYVNNKKTAEDLDLAVSDVDGNGKVNLRDALAVLQYSNKKFDKFPVEM